MDEQRLSLRKFRFKVSSRVSVVEVVFALTLLTTHAMQAQTFSVIYNLTGGTDGEYPDAGVTVGPSGVLYGTGVFGGTGGAGTVFKLSQVNSSWVFSPLYEFTGGSDGARPIGGVVIGPNGALYGTTMVLEEAGGQPDAFRVCRKSFLSGASKSQVLRARSWEIGLCWKYMVLVLQISISWEAGLFKTWC